MVKRTVLTHDKKLLRRVNRTDYHKKEISHLPSSAELDHLKAKPPKQKLPADPIPRAMNLVWSLSDAQVQTLISSKKTPIATKGKKRWEWENESWRESQLASPPQLWNWAWIPGEQNKGNQESAWFSRDKQLCTRSTKGCHGNVCRSLFLLGLLAGQSCGFLGFPSGAGKFCTMCLLTYLQHLRWSWGCVGVADWHNDRSHSCLVLSHSILRAGNLMKTCGGIVKLQPFLFQTKLIRMLLNNEFIFEFIYYSILIQRQKDWCHFKRWTAKGEKKKDWDKCWITEKLITYFVRGRG